jgi:site-specific recombinase XerC
VSNPILVGRGTTREPLPVAASLFKTSARCLLTLCNTAWKDRHIPLVDEEVKALRNYLRYRASQLVLDDDIFFLAKNGTSLNVW